MSTVLIPADNYLKKQEDLPSKKATLESIVEKVDKFGDQKTTGSKLNFKPSQ